MSFGRTPSVSSAPAVAEQQARIQQMEEELRQQNATRDADAAREAAAEMDRQRRAQGRASTIKTGPQGILTGNANEAPQLKAVLG